MKVIWIQNNANIIAHCEIKATKLMVNLCMCM